MTKRFRWAFGSLNMAAVFAVSVALNFWSCASADEPTQPGDLGIWRTRTVEPGELTNLRGGVEDTLRTNILRVFFPEDMNLDDLRYALNSPWTKSTVEYFTNLLLEGVPEEGDRTIRESQWETVVCLLAYVGKANADNALYADIKNAFDLLYKRAYAVRKASLARRTLWEGFLENTHSAIRQYGLLDLAGDMFWKVVEEWGVGGIPGDVLEDLGDESVLAKLKEWQKQRRWEKSPRQSSDLDETVFLLESALKYPELRKIKNFDKRTYVAGWLAEYDGNLQRLESYAQGWENTEVGSALEAILARLKAEQVKPPEPEK